MYKNMFMKKVLVLLTALCLLLSVCCAFGCNDGDGGETPPSTTYVLSAYKKTIAIDEEYQLEVMDAEGKTITWSVDDRRVATVSENGLVQGITEGTTKVYARIDEQVLSCEITVKVSLFDFVEITLPNELENQITIEVLGSYTFAPVLVGAQESAQIYLTSDSASVTVEGFTITGVSAVANAKLTFTCSLSGVAPLVVYVTVVQEE